MEKIIAIVKKEFKDFEVSFKEKDRDFSILNPKNGKLFEWHYSMCATTQIDNGWGFGLRRDFIKQIKTILK